MIPLRLTTFLSLAINAQAQATIPVQPLTDVDESHHTGYFSDPYHVPYVNESRVYISGTTHKYLECDGGLSPRCATPNINTTIQWNLTADLFKEMNNSKVQLCGVAGIHPFQSVSNGKRSWDAAMTLHVQEQSKECKGISGWSVIVHAHPNGSTTNTPPDSWVGDTKLVGNFSENVDANYDGKYFQTPEGKLYLVYQAQMQGPPTKRDAVCAWPMSDPKTLDAENATLLLGPDEGLNSENYHDHTDNGFKLIETGNIRTINGKFLMAYSVGAYNRPTYKLAVAYSDTFLPERGQQYRKVMKENPDGLWESKNQKEVYYLLQADQNHTGWHYIGDQVLAPGVPTVAKIGSGNSWVLTFAGYNPKDTGDNGTEEYDASHRRPFFIDLDVNVPTNTSVKQASDQDLQTWITPSHG